MKNNNQAIVRKLTSRALHSDKRRNFFIIAAIALTALLLTTIFNIGMSFYESSQSQGVDFSGQIQSFSLLAIFCMFTGYLLVYNVLYISVSRNVRFYGLLKTLGTTPKQIRRLVKGQVMRLCVVGIPIGLILGALVSFAIIPLIIMSNDIEMDIISAFSPFIYIGTIIFTLITAFIGVTTPSKKAARITAIEAVRNTGEITIKSHANSFAHGKPYKMAFRNIFRERKQAVMFC